MDSVGLTITQVAEASGLTRSAVAKRIDRGSLRAGYDEWGRRVVPVEELERTGIAIEKSSEPDPLCICGAAIERPSAMLCVRCAESLSVAQSRYVAQFERLLRTGEGIDLALQIATRIGINTNRILRLRSEGRKRREWARRAVRAGQTERKAA